MQQQDSVRPVAGGAEVAPGRYPFTLRPLSELMAAEIIGLDLRELIDDAVRDAIYDAFLRCHVIAFRDQDLSKDQQAAFSQRFGELEGHVVRDWHGNKVPIVQSITNLDADGNPTSRPYTHGNYFWHTDKSYHAIPSLTTMLHAIELPPAGGATQFANMHAAYDALPQATRDAIADLRVEHSWEANRRNTGNRPASEEEKRERPPVQHPMVRTHPDTGRKGLYIGTHTSHVIGMPVEEGRALLAELLEHATQPQFVYTHQWRKGDLVMWDNRCLLHRAIRDYDMEKHRRVLHRTVVRGTVPY